jgi:hypothetical protein
MEEGGYGGLTPGPLSPGPAVRWGEGGTAAAGGACRGRGGALGWVRPRLEAAATTAAATADGGWHRAEEVGGLRGPDRVPPVPLTRAGFPYSAHPDGDGGRLADV